MATPPDFTAYIAPVTGASGALASLAAASTGVPKVLTDIMPLALGMVVFAFAWKRVKGALRGR